MDKTTGVDYRTKKDPAQIRSEIEDTRAQLGETVDEIKERFSSEHMKSQVKEATIGRARGAMQETARKARHLSTSAMETVKRDPLPYISIGAGFGIGIGGLVWLLRKGDGNGYSEEYGYGAREFEYPSETHASPEGLEEEPGGMKDLARRTQEKARMAREQAGMAVERAREQAGMAMSRAKEKTGEYKERALERSRELHSQVGESIERNPWVLGSLFFALGSAIGFLFPSMAAPLVEKAAPLVEKMGLETEKETSESEPMNTMEAGTVEAVDIHSELEIGDTGKQEPGQGTGLGGSTYPGRGTGRPGGSTEGL